MKKMFMLMAAVALMFAGCSKENPEPSGSEDCFVSRILFVEGMHSQYIDFEYDNNGRIIKYTQQAVGGDYDTYMFSYASGTIELESNRYDSERDEAFHRISSRYDLDNSGRIASVTKTYYGNWTETIDFEYNSQGQLMKIGANGTVQYVGDNIASSTNSNHRSTFTYDNQAEHIPFLASMSELFQSPFSEGDDVLYEMGYFGKIIKNRVTKIEHAYSEADGSFKVYDTHNFSYQTDNRGKVASIGGSFVHEEYEDPGSYTLTYEYVCK